MVGRVRGLLIFTLEGLLNHKECFPHLTLRHAEPLSQLGRRDEAVADEFSVESLQLTVRQLVLGHEAFIVHSRVEVLQNFFGAYRHLLFFHGVQSPGLRPRRPLPNTRAQSYWGRLSNVLY